MEQLCLLPDLELSLSRSVGLVSVESRERRLIEKYSLHNMM